MSLKKTFFIRKKGGEGLIKRSIIQAPGPSPGKVLGIGIRRFCFLPGQAPASTGERRRRPESALRLGPQSLACLSSSERHDIRERSLCDCGRCLLAIKTPPGGGVLVNLLV